MRQFSTVIFDLDGTLLDTLADIAAAANRVLEEMGAPAEPVDRYRYYVGDGVINLFRRVLPEQGQSKTSIETCVKRFREAYAELWNATTRPYAGIPDLLDSIGDAKLKTAVLSNKPHEFTQQCIRGFLPDHPFGVVLGQSREIPPKPDPTGVLEIVRILDVSPESCVYVGDTATDMQTATAVSMFAVGVTWGFRPREELAENGAHVLIDHPAELLEVLGISHA